MIYSFNYLCLGGGASVASRCLSADRYYFLAKKLYSNVPSLVSRRKEHKANPLFAYFSKGKCDIPKSRPDFSEMGQKVERKGKERKGREGKGRGGKGKEGNGRHGESKEWVGKKGRRSKKISRFA
ncbi:hypothetical protein IE53DRAFT_236673 [Violaceomyces palustris]|uniref:Uncharacterized protein n=1 Tax=Violaceomyces palustris TaxID=1673888 RepID=A0ACD0P4J3_9BASI|nr:hypothetical protein IE53DRAFT_236673 [Violaceomyces palustris]